jgi:hypothetical protein
VAASPCSSSRFLDWAAVLYVLATAASVCKRQPTITISPFLVTFRVITAAAVANSAVYGHLQYGLIVCHPLPSPAASYLQFMSVAGIGTLHSDSLIHFVSKLPQSALLQAHSRSITH